MIRVAAVAGRRVSHSLLQAATGMPDAELEEALREEWGPNHPIARHQLSNMTRKNKLRGKRKIGRKRLTKSIKEMVTK